MTKTRWLLFLGLVAALGAMGTVSAMSTDSRDGAAPAPPGVPDIRPYLADKVLPPELRDSRRPGFRPLARPGQGTGTTYLVDDFEAPAINENLWLRIYDLDEPPEEYGEYYWALSRCRSNPPGVQSLRAIGGGANGQGLPCDATYPNGGASAAIMRLDLSTFASPTQLDLKWDFWLNTRYFESGGVAPDGLFLIYLFDNPETGKKEWVTLAAITSAYPERFFEVPWTVDMLKAKEIYPPYREFDLHAAGQVDLLFLFKTKREAGGELTEGVYIDNIRLESDAVPVSPTPGGETATPTATIEVTEPPVDTPTPTDTPDVTPTDTPDVTPTDTPEEPVTPTATPTEPNGPRPFQVYLPALAHGSEPAP